VIFTAKAVDFIVIFWNS